MLRIPSSVSLYVILVIFLRILNLIKVKQGYFTE